MHECLRKIYRKGRGYEKAGVTFYELAKEAPERGTFERRAPRERASMAVVDRINEQMGRHTVALAGSGIERSWVMSAS